MLTKVKSQTSKVKRCKVYTWWLIGYCLLPIASSAQCAMCRASLESEGNKTKVEAINDGIVFLMAIPYVLVAVIGIVVYRMYKKRG